MEESYSLKLLLQNRLKIGQVPLYWPTTGYNYESLLPEFGNPIASANKLELGEGGSSELLKTSPLGQQQRKQT